MTDPEQKHCDRLEALEVRFAFQEDLIESLNTIVARQQDEIRQLEHQIRHMRDRFDHLAENDHPVVDSLPPHY